MYLDKNRNREVCPNRILAALPSVWTRAKAGAALALLIIFIPPTVPLVQTEESWTYPRRMSSLEADASEAYMTSDRFGFVHVFWVETGFDHQRSLIMYSRFDGQEWTPAVDVYASWPGTAIKSVAPFADSVGNLHLAWSEGFRGPILYSQATITEAESALNWTIPVEVDVPAQVISMLIDSLGVIHLVYTSGAGEEDAGVYYVRSENDGRAWGNPIKLDPDIPSDGTPRWLNAEIDTDDGIHAIWGYADAGGTSLTGRWIRYAHSLDRGDTWTSPISIDFAQNSGLDDIHMPNPGIAVSGLSVHAIWGGSEILEEASVNRRYRASFDRGETWGEVTQILQGLTGQAIGDGLAFDGMGRLHFAGQLRWPQGIYHAVLSDDLWSEPELAYFIREDSDDDFENRVHAHNVRLQILKGNQLVLAFTPPPAGSVQSVLYTMTHTIEDIDPQYELLEAVAEQQAQPPDGEISAVASSDLDVESDFPSSVPEDPSASVVPIGSGQGVNDQTPENVNPGRPLILAATISFLVVAGFVGGSLIVRRRSI